MSSLKTTHRWAVAQQNPELEKELSAGLGIPGLVARIMVAHGITSIEEGQLFLTPSLDRDWADPLIIPGMSVVADRVERAIRNHERIAVFGDFDVDGITSTCLLTEALCTFGADVTPFIPHRFDEGYGLSRAALDRVNELARPQLIVTVDNGIAAKEEVSYLEDLGIDLVVTDHHEPSDQVPQGVPLTDPKLEDEGPSRELAGAGVALKLVQVLGERLGKPSYWRSLIEVAALGTVSDMMPLTPENRALVAEGIQQMRVTARPGDIIGITGPVACGKSTLGRVFLCEAPYQGSVCFGGRELSTLTPRQIAATVGYLSHDPELSADTVQNNVLCGSEQDVMPWLAAAALKEEVLAMEKGTETVIGSGGTRLSGGQAQRLALARTLAHPRPVLVLDDPFSALDRSTEDAIFAELQAYARDKVVFLISHRLYHFPQMQQIIFMEGGRTTVGTHEELMAAVPVYRQLYESQTGLKGGEGA